MDLKYREAIEFFIENYPKNDEEEYDMLEWSWKLKIVNRINNL